MNQNQCSSPPVAACSDPIAVSQLSNCRTHAPLKLHLCATLSDLAIYSVFFTRIFSVYLENGWIHIKNSCSLILNAMVRKGGAINRRWNLGAEGWGRREGCALLRGPRVPAAAHPSSELTSKRSCVCSLSQWPHKHPVGNTEAWNPPWFLFTLVCSDSLPVIIAVN